MPGHRAADGQRALRDTLAGLERDGRRRLELLRRVARLREPVRERHREARRLRGGDQLLRARLAVRLLGARRPRRRRAGRRRRSSPQRSCRCRSSGRPARRRSRCGRLPSTPSPRCGCRSAVRRPSCSRTSLERPDRDLELVERRLARRQPLQPEPRREQRHQDAVVGVLAGEADQLVGDPGDHRQQHDAADDQPVPRRTAEAARRRRRPRPSPRAGTRCRSAGGSASASARSPA